MPSEIIIGSLIGGGVAAMVGGAVGICNTVLARRSEERKQIRELAVSVAIENFKIYKEASARLGGTMQPLDLYLIHAMHLVAALDGRVKTPEQIREHLRQSSTVCAAAIAEIDEYNKKMQEARHKDMV